MKNKTKLIIGSHLSVSAGYLKMGNNALNIGANTFQFFARNPRGAGAKAINPDELKTFREFLQENSFAPIIAHAPYTINFCSSDRHLRELSLDMFQQDLQRLEHLPHNFYNLHPGSRILQDKDMAVEMIADNLNKGMFDDMNTIVLLETMSGKGSEVGQSFEELNQILLRVNRKDKIGICMDACHMWDSGYDIVNNLDGVLKQFNQIIGLQRLKAFHINDSLNTIGSKKDRHSRIGEGLIGRNAILNIINHPLLCHLPFILETPTDLDGHKREIRMIRRNYMK